MIETIYIEHAVADHPRTRALRKRFPAAHVIECDHHGEVFNRANQSFRAQKQKPALILAAKTGRRLLPVPAGYALDGTDGFYFSHMLNCLYDCRYCFLQGMFRSAHYVLFVNYEDFFADIRALCAQTDATRWLFSGYDCDSLALEPVSGFAAAFIPLIEQLDNAWLELRTKSTQVRSLLERQPCPRVVCAFSLNPQAVIDAVEARTPGLDARLAAMRRLQDHGWPIALRFDPLLLGPEFIVRHEQFFRQVFRSIDAQRLHSITYGGFRLPHDYHQRMRAQYPDEPLFAAVEKVAGGGVGYDPDDERAMLDWCDDTLARYAAGVPRYRQSPADTAAT